MDDITEDLNFRRRKSHWKGLTADYTLQKKRLVKVKAKQQKITKMKQRGKSKKKKEHSEIQDKKHHCFMFQASKFWCNSLHSNR